MTYLVSVIMPCLNSENTISEAVESVLKQDYKNLELEAERSVDVFVLHVETKESST